MQLTPRGGIDMDRKSSKDIADTQTPVFLAAKLGDLWETLAQLETVIGAGLDLTGEVEARLGVN
jgi:hypothetical protein